MTSTVKLLDELVKKAERENANEFVGLGDDGWSAFPGTWTYASANSFTITGDYASWFPTGTKIKLTQTSAKYFYVGGASYSAPNTTVTVTGGSDYSLANAAITLPLFSYAATPRGFPQFFSFASTVTGSTGSAGTYAETVYTSRFRIVGNSCYVNVAKSITNVGSWTGTFRVAMPVGVTIASGLGNSGETGGAITNTGTTLTPKANLIFSSSSYFLFRVVGGYFTWTSVAVGDWVYLMCDFQIA